MDLSWTPKGWLFSVHVRLHVCVCACGGVRRSGHMRGLFMSVCLWEQSGETPCHCTTQLRTLSHTRRPDSLSTSWDCLTPWVVSNQRALHSSLQSFEASSSTSVSCVIKWRIAVILRDFWYCRSFIAAYAYRPSLIIEGTILVWRNQWENVHKINQKWWYYSIRNAYVTARDEVSVSQYVLTWQSEVAFCWGVKCALCFTSCMPTYQQYWWHWVQF